MVSDSDLAWVDRHFRQRIPRIMKTAALLAACVPESEKVREGNITASILFTRADNGHFLALISAIMSPG